ncbi:MAG: RluA family pseudouridine synthase [Muribaculaceae bacterium]|nr:RluA family pseudouridine synthase [Muribaculaceae bacterium]
MSLDNNTPETQMPADDNVADEMMAQEDDLDELSYNEGDDFADDPSARTDYSYQLIKDSIGRERYEHYRFEVDKGQALLRIDKFLTERMQKTSRNRIQQAAEAECILVNTRPVKASYKVKPGDVVSIVMDRPHYELEIIPEDIPLDIVYEDDEVLVVNKPAGLVVHPGHGNYTGTLVNALAWHFKDNPNYDADDPRMGLVHRIDKDTSGLLVIAKTPDAKTFLGRQFFNKTTKRQYIALVWGDFDNDEGTITGNIARNPKDKLQMAVFEDESIGKHAVTHYKVLERFGYVTLVQCILETGRTHQIRVHMKHIGHPLFNDVRYGGDQILKGTTFSKYKQFIANCFDTCPRQALHAKTLGFVHPTTGKQMDFDSEIPADMQALIEKWRAYRSNA